MTNKTTTTAIFKNIRLFLRLNRWEFTPGLIPTVAVILLLPLLISLGIWQMHRAVAKQQLLNQFASRSQQPPQPLANNELVYTPVQVTGAYDPAHLILLDNRIVNHQVGYDVLIPFTPADGKLAILINLGWIPKSTDQNQLITPSSSSVVGLVQFPQHNLVLAHSQTGLRWPLLVEDIRIPELSQALNRPLYPFILLLSGNGGFTHHWTMITSVTPARHRGYAVQWFALALTLVILYFKLNIRRSAHDS